jgi:hypothetical protein
VERVIGNLVYRLSFWSANNELPVYTAIHATSLDWYKAATSRHPKFICRVLSYVEIGN